MKRRTIAILVVAVVVVAALAGWLAGHFIQSPAEAAARRSAPPASPILVPAEERLLSTDIVTRGTARFGSAQVLTLVPSELKSGRQIVTGLPEDGTELAEGDVVLTVSGRPVFLLEGGEPSYRDLGPGIVGEDVRQLERALKRLGFDPGPADGVYDAGTEAAVAELYGAASYEPVQSDRGAALGHPPARGGAGRERERRRGRPASGGRGDLRRERSGPRDRGAGRARRPAERADHDGDRRRRGDRQLGSDRGGAAAPDAG